MKITFSGFQPLSSFTITFAVLFLLLSSLSTSIFLSSPSFNISTILGIPSHHTALAFKAASSSGTVYSFIKKWGSLGTGDGEFNNTEGVAIDPKTGNVYIGDYYNNRIQKFDSNGTFITKWGSLGTGDGQFNQTEGVAIDPKTSNVYVTDYYNDRVQKFDSNGTFITKWGSSGTGNGQFNFPSDVAIDPKTGNLYVSDSNNNRIQVFAPR